MASKVTNNPYRIVRRPRITEKAALIGAQGNTVVFEVHPQASKLEIKSAVEKIFEVKVKSIRTLNYKGKLRRVRQSIGYQPRWKKAYVSLREGNTIDVMEGL